ncbi:MAG: leucine-rich repeat domain-containing protein [Candidatus Ventricola sp.]
MPFSFKTIVRLDKPAREIVWETLACVGNKNAHTIIVEVRDGLAQVDLTGYGVQLYAQRQDKGSVYIGGSVDENGCAVVTLDERCYAVEGRLRCTVEISKGDVIMAAAQVCLLVGKAHGDVIIDPGESIPSLEALMAQIAEMKAATEKANSAAQAAQIAADEMEERFSEVSESMSIQIASAENAALASAGNAAAAQQSARSAEQSATAAQSSAENAASDADAALAQAGQAQNAVEQMSMELSGKVDGAYVLDGALYLTSGGEVVAGPFSGFGGGSGGSSGATMAVTLSNLLESRTLTVAGGSAVLLRFAYSSVDEEGMDDGEGIGTVTVGGVRKAVFTAAQGENAIDIAPYLASGANTVRIRVENSEGSAKTLTYSVTMISLTMSTTFAEMAVYTGAVVFAYTVTGSGTKTVHFAMDGVEIGTEEVVSSGRSRSYAIAQQSDGAHVLTCWATLVQDGVEVSSNVLTVGMMFVTGAMAEPSVLTTFDRKSAVQGEALNVPFMVYDPASESAQVSLRVLAEDGSVYSEQTRTVDRTAQTWVVQNYPTGAIRLSIACGTAKAECALTVSESSVTVTPVTDALLLHFDPTGRSNGEEDAAAWTDGSVTAAFEDIGFGAADGWMTDADGASCLRILPGGQMTIPFAPFASDARESGLTIEVEMATHNVRDYDTVVLSCLSGGRGFYLASQYAQLSSEQSSVGMQFREDEKVRVSFAVEPRSLHRLIYVYVDGILCGVTQYPESDNFAQTPTAGLTIGAESAGIDLYRIRIYGKGLTRAEILDNAIADMALLAERTEAARRNDIFDLAGDIVVSKLPATLPYMVISCAELPQYKGDKKDCAIEYVSPADPSRGFTCESAQIDVQGTSSAGYKKKNFKWKIKSGFTYTASGEAAEGYMLREGSMPASVFCMKADVASSEGANNVELVCLYNDTVPHKTPAQEEDSRVRVGIDGVPCVVFWQNTETGDVRFWGKYNFNHDKGAENVFGLTDGCESWETLNNTSNRVIYKSADFTGTAWQDDFEARYPEDNTDPANLAVMAAWVASTDRSAVSSDEEKAERLQKFRDEFEEHFILEPMLFYYLFTETFLMVDSRAKNFFPTTFDGAHWFPFPYDFDTAIGINNEGQLVFDYDLEDTDTVDGSNVFNGQDSVLFTNLRDAFPDELSAMYKTLRSGGVFSCDEVLRRFTAHQSVWPEAVWNEDAWEKYLEPLENDNDGSYLTMLQGSKASQRAWWLFNGFRYRDSKYQCGDAQSQFITLRCYAVGDITVTPYSHIWPRIKYGSYTVTRRGKRNEAMTLACPLDAMNDTEVYIYSADRLAAIGDLSPLQVGYANFSMATKLQSLKLGDGAADYANTRLTELYVGNNELLTLLDVRNCVNLSMTVDLSGCVGIETILAKGSSVTGFTLPVGGRLRTLELPGTVTNLTIRDQKQFETLTMDGYGALTTLRLENTPGLPVEDILLGADALTRARLIGMEWEAESEESLTRCIERLEGCIGMDAAGSNTDRAVVTGRVSVPSISAELLTRINDDFPELVVVAGGAAQYVVRYINYDGTLLTRAVVGEGDAAPDPVAEGTIEAPTREGTEDTRYAYTGFILPEKVSGNLTLTAQYETQYRVRFMNGDAVYDEQWIVSGQAASTPGGTPAKASTAQYSYAFSRWEGDYASITAPTEINAVFTATVRTYTVYFYNGSTLLQTVTNVPYGGSASYTGSTPTYTGDDAEDYEFTGFSPSGTNITGDTSCYAQFRYNGYVYTKLIDRSISGDYTNETVMSVGDYAFNRCSALTSVSLPAATTIGSNSFQNCTALTSISLPTATSIGSYAFQGCSALSSITLPAVTSIGEYAFQSCSALTIVSLSAATSIGGYAFFSCSKFEALILSNAEAVCTLSSTSAFNSSLISKGTGYIYVPAALVDSYKAATNWSTYADQIRAIEDYPEITGGENS